MNDIHTLRDHGPDAAPPSPAVLSAARAALVAEIDGVAGRSFTRPFVQRRSRARLLISSAAVAATAAAFAVWGPSVGAGPGIPSAAAAVVLAPFEMPDFPVSLSATPAGLADPLFDGGPGGVTLYYNSLGSGSRDQVTVVVTDTDPGWPSDPGITVTTPESVTVNGHAGEFVVLDFGPDSGTDADILGAVVRWEQRPGVWVSVGGSGSFTDLDKLVGTAQTVVFQPQPVALRLGLAPAGWDLMAFKNGGTILTLVSDADPDQTLTVNVPDRVVPPEAFPAEVEGVSGDPVQLTLNARPAQLVPTDHGWFLQASAPDGTVFTLQAPASFSFQQVVDVAAQVTHR